MAKTNEKRSWPITIVAAALGIVIAAITYLVLPLDDINKTLFFIGGVALVILCVFTAVQGKKIALRDTIDLIIRFWS